MSGHGAQCQIGGQSLVTMLALQVAFATQVALLPQSMLQRLSAVQVPPLGQAAVPLQSSVQLEAALQLTVPRQALSAHEMVQPAPTEAQSTRCAQLSLPQVMLQSPVPLALQRAVSQLP